MKISKTQLKRIIKEELGKALNEAYKRYDEMTEEELLDVMVNPEHWKHYYAAKEQLLSGGYPESEMPPLVPPSQRVPQGPQAMASNNRSNRELDESIEALGTDLDPEQIRIMVEALIQIGYNFGAPMLLAFMGRLGYEGAATAMAKDALKRQDKNFLVNFLEDEITGYKKKRG